MAIGAGRAQVAKLVLEFGVRIAGIGTLVGVGLAWFGSKTVAGLLFGITPLSPAVYLTAVLTLACVVAAACAIPALRAMRVQPVDVLRAD
jgi:ABC-type antimicrobial peptide transport system permease subunit